MKILYIVLLAVFITIPAQADQWCMWDGSQGVECQSDSKGFIRIPNPNGFKVSTESIANNKGYYRVVITQPTLGVDQVRDAEVWGFDGTNITLTWSVRDLSAGEIDQRDAAPMPLSEYYLWKALLVKGVITSQEAQNALPQELIDAYNARDRLEQ
jgi:hypothetical protein